MRNPHNTIEVDSYLPCGGRGLIRPDPRSSKTQGGILLPGGGSHGNVRIGTLLDQGEARWENGHRGPLPVPDFDDRREGSEVRVLYFEARMTPVRVWTGNMEEIPDPAWRQPADLPEGEVVEHPLISVKVYEELQIIPHPAILGEVEVEAVPEDLDESERVPEGSVKEGLELVRPSPALTKAISARQVPRGKIVTP